MVAVQAVLQSDKGMGSLPGGSLNFERWIKHGLMADDLLNSSNDSEQLLLQGSPLPSFGCTAHECHCSLAHCVHQAVFSEGLLECPPYSSLCAESLVSSR